MSNDHHQGPNHVFPEDAAERKTYPVFSGCIKYFPDALAAVAHVSYLGNEQHHPGEPLHWDKSKSTDHGDALIRHVMEGEYDKVAWRALALLQMQIDADKAEYDGAMYPFPECSQCYFSEHVSRKCVHCTEGSNFASSSACYSQPDRRNRNG